MDDGDGGGGGDGGDGGAGGGDDDDGDDDHDGCDGDDGDDGDDAGEDDTSRGPGSRLLLFTRARESPSSTLLLFAILCEQKHHKITKRNGVASMIVDFRKN